MNIYFNFHEVKRLSKLKNEIQWNKSEDQLNLLLLKCMCKMLKNNDKVKKNEKKMYSYLKELISSKIFTIRENVIVIVKGYKQKNSYYFASFIR